MFRRNSTHPIRWMLMEANLTGEFRIQSGYVSDTQECKKEMVMINLYINYSVSNLKIYLQGYYIDFYKKIDLKNFKISFKIK